MTDKLYAKLCEFHTMTNVPNWDLENAPVMPSQIWSDVWGLCKTVRSVGLDDPWVTPNSDGSIDLCWCLPRGRVISVLFFYDSSDYPWALYNKEKEIIEHGTAQYICGLITKLFELLPVKAKEYQEKHKEDEQC